MKCVEKLNSVFGKFLCYRYGKQSSKTMNMACMGLCQKHLQIFTLNENFDRKNY